MSHRSFLPLLALLVLASACGGARPGDEPTTAKEKQRREARANPDESAGSKKWGGWRYKGDRAACFYSLNGKCFKTENAACQAARCIKPKRCTVTGGGPALVSCK
jgi:hypothetical protein